MHRWPWRNWLAAGAVLTALQNIIHLLACIIDPLQLDYSEGLVLGGLARIAQHPAPATVYSFNPAFYNTTDLAYPPVFPYTAAALAGLLSFFKLNQPELYAARLVTLAGLGIAAWLVYRLICLNQPKRLVAIAAAGLFFCYHPAIYWGVYARVDALALVLSLAGLYLIARAETKTSQVDKNQPTLWSSQAYLLAVLLFGLAFFTKQSFVAAPAAVTLYLFFSGRRRMAIEFAGLLVVLIGLSLVALVIATGGKYLFFLTLERFTAFSVAKLLKTWGLFLLLYGPLCLITLWQARRSWRQGGAGRLIVLWGGLAFAISLTVGKAGAADYYFFEVMSFIGVLVGWFWAELPTLRRSWMLPALAALQLVILLVIGIWLDYPANDRDAVRAADGQAARYVEQYGGRNGKIFVEMSGPAIAAGRPDAIFDHFIFRQLALAHQRDGQALVADFANKRFKLALFGYDILHDDYRPDVTEFTPWPPGFEQAVRANYYLLQDIRGRDGRPYAWALLPKN